MGSPGLNLRSGEKEFRAEFREHLLHQIVLAHGDAAGQQ